MVRWLKNLLPLFIRRRLSYLKGLINNGRRWVEILTNGMPIPGQISVFYGFDHIPRLDEPAHGGIVKFQYMQDTFPNAPRRFNLLYMVSSALPADWPQMLWLARRKGARVVWNQNGVGYPAWHGPGWEGVNRPMAKVLHTADYVFYQSRFCKLSADRFLGERKDQWEILYNPVDTNLFTPAMSDPDPQSLILLSVGSVHAFYRFEGVVRTAAQVARSRPKMQLIVAGRLAWKRNRDQVMHEAYGLIDDLHMQDKVVFMAPYLQADAPLMFQRAHILLHTQYNDSCPTTVLEAMACGLPVVYSHSGGVPELVGNEAGIGIPAELSWEQEFPPAPEALAEAVLKVAERRAQYAEAARQRAVECFDLRPWLKRHREVFESLVRK